MGSPATASGEVTGYCRNCGKGLTPENLREVQGVYYCRECLGAIVQQAQPMQHPGRPAMAAILGCVPGLGAVYNGEYVKGLMHVLIFGTIISLIDRAPGLFIPLLIAWILYMPFEAYHTARAQMLGQTPPGSLKFGGSRQQIGPLMLIALGVLFLLDQLGVMDIGRIAEFWPVGLIALGVWLLVKRK